MLFLHAQVLRSASEVNISSLVILGFGYLCLLQFLRGDCFECAGRKCTTLGWHVDQSLGERNESKKFYSITTEQSPFCSEYLMICSPHQFRIYLYAFVPSNSPQSILHHSKQNYGEQLSYG